MTFFLQQASLNRIYNPYREAADINEDQTLLENIGVSMEFCDGSLTITVSITVFASKKSRLLQSCRFITVLDQWAMTASFYWLLIEGVQLYTLLVVTVLSVKKYFYTYMAFGWGVS